MKALLQLDNDFKDNIEVVWRLARMYYLVGGEQTDPAKQQEDYQKGYEAALRAIQIDPNHFAGHKWAGITFSAVEKSKTTKERIAGAPKIKEYFKKAEELAPTDPTIKLALGKWSFAIANLGWIEKNAAALLFGALPDTTLEESLSYFMAAEKIIAGAPELYTTVDLQVYFMIGKTYHALKNNEKAKEYLNKAIAAKPCTTDDKNMVEEAKTILASISSSWW
uniref:Regulator of microtubule dynamics protein 1 n=1 Tax=Arcella intermedia TaxID=1963864 RepID=A0A6B2LGL9_9EUKA